MADLTVGQASLRLVPSLEGFNEAVKAEGEKINDLRIGVVLDDADAKAKLDELKLSTDELGAKSPTITPKVDSAQATADLGALKTAADAAAGGSGGGGFFGLATAAASLGPALVPIGAVGLAGILALGPALLSAGAGLGAFALAAGGDFGQLETAAKNTLTSFQALEKPIVQPVINGAIKDLIPIFSDLAPLVDSTASELTKLENEGSSALNAPFWRGFITFVSAEAGPAIDSFAHLAGGLGTAFAGLAQGLSPLITGIEGDLDGVGSKLTTFGQTVGTSSGFQSFILFVQQEAPVVGQLFLNLGTDAGKFAADLAPVGAATLSVLDPLTKFAGTLLGLHGPFGTNIVDLGLAYFAFTKLSPVLVDAQAKLLAFSITANGVEGVAGGSDSGLAHIVAAIGGIGPAAAIALPAAAALGVGLVLAGNEAATAAAQTKAFLDGVTTESASTLPQLSDKLGDLKTKLSELDPEYQSGKLGFAAFAEAGTQLQTSLKATTDAQSNYHDNLNTLSGQLGISDASVQKLATSLNINLGTALDPAQLRQFKAALEDQAAQAGLTASAFKAMAQTDGDSFAAMSKAGTTAANTASTAWKNYGNAINQFSSGTLPATSANISQFYSLNLLQATQFSANVQKAIKDGYNPALISSILQAGPAQASPLLQGLVSAQGSSLVTLVNQTTAALASEGQQAVEEARLTAEAVAAKSSTIAAELPQALALSQALTTTNAAAAVQAVATEYGLSVPQVETIAKQYGIALPNAISTQISQVQTNANAQVAGYLQSLETGAPKAGSAGLDASVAFAGGLKSPAALKAIDDAGRTATAEAASAGESNKNLFITLGSDLTAGIAAGMTASAALTHLQTTAAHVVNGALLSAQEAGVVHSPSQLFADEVGVYLTEGIAMGMTSPAGLGSLHQAVGTVITTVTSGLTGLTNTLRQMATTITSPVATSIQGLKNDLNQLASVESTLTNAENTERTAQQSLTQARIDATNQLTNYTDQLADGALQAQQDQLSLLQAKQQLETDTASGTATPLQLAQDQLAVEQATQAIKDQADQYAQLQQAAAAAAAAGVEGNQQVVTALQGVATAQAAVTAAATAPPTLGSTSTLATLTGGTGGKVSSLPTAVAAATTPNNQTRRPISTATTGILSAPSPQSQPLIPAGQLVGTAIGPAISVQTQIVNSPVEALALSQAAAAIQRQRKL